MSALTDLERRCLRALLAERRAWERMEKGSGKGSGSAGERWWTAVMRLSRIGDELLAASRKRGRGGKG